MLALAAIVMAGLMMPVSAGGNKTPVTGHVQMQPAPDWLPTEYRDHWLGNGNYNFFCWTYDLVTNSDIRLTGYEVMQYHATVDWNTGTGIAWGKIEIISASGGTWEGTFNGKINSFYHDYHMTLVGKGAYAGKVAKLDYNGYQPGDDFTSLWDVTGYIVE